MRALSFTATLLMLLSLTATAEAGKNGPSRSYVTRSLSSASTISSRPSVRAAAERRISSTTPTSSAHTASVKTRASMLDRPGPKPSPAIASAVSTQERSSGTGLISTVFLLSLLSNNGLSASDRSWLQSSIAERQAEEVAEGKVVLPDINFTYQPIPLQPLVDQTFAVRVSAGISGKSIPIKCEFPEGEIIEREGESVLQWIPKSRGSFVITCRAGGLFDQRLLTVR